MIKNLSCIFSEEGILTKSSGLPVNKKGALCIAPDTDRELLSLYADLTARLGVELAGFQPPLTSARTADALRLSLDSSVETGACQLRLAGGGVELAASSLEDLRRGTEYMTVLYPLDGKGGSLEAMAGIGKLTSVIIDTASLTIREAEESTAGVLADAAGISADKTGAAADKGGELIYGNRSSFNRAESHYKQNRRMRIVMGGEPGQPENCAEALLAAALRIAMENYETVYPYCVKALPEGCGGIYLREAEKAEVRKEGDNIIFCGKGKALEEQVYAYASCERDPFASDILKDVEDMIACRNEAGQAAFAAAYGSASGEAGDKASGSGSSAQNVLITREYARGMVDREAMARYLTEKTGKTEVRNFNDGKEVFRSASSLSWEGDDFMELFRSKALPLVKPGDDVRVEGRLSEDMEMRSSLASMIRDQLKTAGAAETEADIFCAYKSGYSWLEEKVLPMWTAQADERLDSVKITFPYLLNERGDDTFEDESAPNYGKHMDDPQKFFDIPTRWLQELFPADELIERETGISREKVEFVRDDKLASTYKIEFFGKDGEKLLEDSFDVKYVEKPYIKKYPQIGVTHVTTGWIKVEVNGKTVLDQRVETDIEKVWRVLEDETIPQLEQRLVKRYGKDGLAAAQPLFNRLQINVRMSEVDRDLGFREERISTAEAMQEDIYFYILDWFKTYGERECEKELDNIGLIMPEPEIMRGERTEIEVILYDDLAAGAQLQVDDKQIEICEACGVKVAAESICFSADSSSAEVTAVVSGEGALARAKALGEMIETGVIEMFSDCCFKLFLVCRDGTAEITIPKRKTMVSSLDEEKKNEILAGDVVDYEQYLELLGYYDGRPGVKIIPAETTYKGRKIFCIECFHRDEGVCYSASKMTSERITALFTARHHGNEASSLNSTFMLLDRLLSDMKGDLERINVVLVPFINIDGGQLHCDVHRKHPKWLCHPARYNSAGFEFRKDFNNPDSIYGEARLLGKLWNKYLFDIVTDNHGFEGHELVQPFSGYISPWYKSFWVPRAFYYGYIWFSGEKEHMLKIGNAIRQKVSDAINCDGEIYRLNREFEDRFYKYAEKWFPDLFRLERFNEVVFYWTDTDKHPRPANYGVKNPEITAVDWTTEVADETAVGDYMKLNAHAHHISDLALFEVMRECELIIDRAWTKNMSFTRYRRHPLCAGEGEVL